MSYRHLAKHRASSPCAVTLQGGGEQSRQVRAPGGQRPGSRVPRAGPGAGNGPSATHGARHVGGSWGRGEGWCPCCCQRPRGQQHLGVCPQQPPPQVLPAGCHTPCVHASARLSPGALPATLLVHYRLPPPHLPRGSSLPCRSVSCPLHDLPWMLPPHLVMSSEL